MRAAAGRAAAWALTGALTATTTAVLTGAMTAGLAVVAAPAHATEGNDLLVQAWYRQFLQRSAEDAAADTGRGHWVARLDDGEPRERVLRDLLRSREHVNRRVSDAYQDHLGRAPDPGAAHWVDGAARHGMALEWVEQNLLASQELYDEWSWAGEHEDLYVQDLYVAVLGRYGWESTRAERAYWAGRVRAVGRLAAVRELWYTDEAVRHRLAGHYSDLLRRTADLDGLTHWAPVQARSDADAVVGLACTEEFFDTRAS